MQFLNLFNSLWIVPGLEETFIFIDSIIYSMLEGIIKIFFTIGNMNFSILTDNFGYLIKNIQNLVGIYILFSVSLVFIQYLVNPEEFKKENGGGESLLKNVITVVIMLVLLNSGLIFGLFNDVQKLVFGNGKANANGGYFEVLSVLDSSFKAEETDLIAKVVFGTKKYTVPYHTLTVSLMQQFLHIAEGDSSLPWSSETGKTSGTFDDPKSLFNMVANSDNSGMFLELGANADTLVSSKEVRYIPLVSAVLGIYMIIKFFNYGLKLIIRFFKLSVMQILSPIAIVSYATPKGKSIFTSFWKTYFALYFELFIRLLVVYLSVYLMGTCITSISEIADTTALNFIEKIALNIMLIMGINKFMDAVPDLIASLFGTKLADENQKSLLGIAGGVLGAGIGGATAIATGALGGAGVAGSLWNGITGAFGGAKAGSDSRNVGSFVSGQIGNIQNSSAKGYKIGDYGGGLQYLRANYDKTFGNDKRMQRKMQHYQDSQQLLTDMATAEKDTIAKNSGYQNYSDMQSSITDDYNQAYQYYQTHGGSFAGSSYATDSRFTGVQSAQDIITRRNTLLNQVDSQMDKVALSSVKNQTSKFNSLSSEKQLDIRKGNTSETYNSAKIDASKGIVTTSAHTTQVNVGQVDKLNKYENSAQKTESTNYYANFKDATKYVKDEETALSSSQRYNNIKN